MKSTVLYARVPSKVYEALKLEAERRGATLSRTTADLLTTALIHESAPELLPPELQAYFNGRRMFAFFAGFIEAAGEDEQLADEGGTNV